MMTALAAVCALAVQPPAANIATVRVPDPNTLTLSMWGPGSFSVTREGYDGPPASFQCVGYSRSNADRKTAYLFDGKPLDYGDWIKAVATAKGDVEFTAELETNSYGGVKRVAATVKPWANGVPTAAPARTVSAVAPSPPAPQYFFAGGFGDLVIPYPPPMPTGQPAYHLPAPSPGVFRGGFLAPRSSCGPNGCPQ